MKRIFQYTGFGPDECIWIASDSQSLADEVAAASHASYEFDGEVDMPGGHGCTSDEQFISLGVDIVVQEPDHHDDADRDRQVTDTNKTDMSPRGGLLRPGS